MQQDITVILNCFKRPQYLKEQIESVQQQTKKPKEIIIWVNDSQENRKLRFENLGDDIKIVRSNHNWSFFGRFTIALLAKSKYIALYDDDTIPGRRWHENCLNTMKMHEGILGGVGIRIANDGKYNSLPKYGWPVSNEKTVEVDLVGHAWFFKKEWTKYLWYEEPYTYDNGEDMHFSYTAQKYGNIKTYVPPHKKDLKETHSSIKGVVYGGDSVASHKNRVSIFYEQRDKCVEHNQKNGWKLYKDKND